MITVLKEYFSREGHLLISDQVPSEFVLKAVENCNDKEFCKLFVEKGETTCKGGDTRYYNSHGMLIDKDSNRMQVKVVCSLCGRTVEMTGSIK